MRELAATATPDQVVQRAMLVSHLTIIADPEEQQTLKAIIGLQGASETTETQVGYNSHMRSVNIAELKNRLSAYLQQVRAGEEIVIRDRNLPVAKIVPLAATEVSAEELALAASGELLLPSETLNQRTFWSIGSTAPVSAEAADAILGAVSQDREERDAGLLGR
jgi:prevent-host-death family protein